MLLSKMYDWVDAFVLSIACKARATASSRYTLMSNKHATWTDRKSPAQLLLAMVRCSIDETTRAGRSSTAECLGWCHLLEWCSISIEIKRNLSLSTRQPTHCNLEHGFIPK